MDSVFFLAVVQGYFEGHSQNHFKGAINALENSGEKWCWTIFARRILQPTLTHTMKEQHKIPSKEKLNDFLESLVWPKIFELYCTVTKKLQEINTFFYSNPKFKQHFAEKRTKFYLTNTKFWISYFIIFRSSSVLCSFAIDWIYSLNVLHSKSQFPPKL